MDPLALVGAVTGSLAAVGTGAKWYLEWRDRRAAAPITERELTELQRLRRQVDELVKQVNGLHLEVAHLTGDVARATANAAAMQARAEAAEARLAEAGEKSDALEAALDKARDERDAANREREDMRVRLVDTMARADGLQSDLEALQRLHAEVTGRFRAPR